MIVVRKGTAVIYLCWSYNIQL